MARNEGRKGRKLGPYRVAKRMTVVILDRVDLQLLEDALVILSPDELSSRRRRDDLVSKIWAAQARVGRSKPLPGDPPRWSIVYGGTHACHVAGCKARGLHRHALTTHDQLSKRTKKER